MAATEQRHDESNDTHDSRGTFQLAAALRYVADGYAVLPVYPVANGHCRCHRGRRCSTPGKHPLGRLVPHGVKNATRDADVIRRWWTAWPNANIGLATGAASGCVVLDVDPAHGGDESLAALPPLPPTRVVRTGSGGRHFYFRHPDGRCRNRIGFQPGLDLRGERGFVVAPPGQNLKGLYVVEVDLPLADLAELPEALVAAFRARPAPVMDGEQVPYRRVRPEPDQTGMIPEGMRDQTLFDLAMRLHRQGRCYDNILATLRITNRERCLPPLGDDQVVQKAKRTLEYGRDDLPPPMETEAGRSAYWRISQLRRLAASIPWRRQAGRSAYKVLMAMHAKALRLTLTTITYSCREGAIDTGLSLSTVFRALRYIEATSWALRREGATPRPLLITHETGSSRVTRGFARSYDLIQPPWLQATEMSTPKTFISPHRGGVLSSVDDNPMHALWMNGALSDGTAWGFGPIGWLIRRAVRAAVIEPTFAALARAVHGSPSAVADKAKRLLLAGLITRDEAGWKIGPADIDILAERLKLVARREKAKARYRAEQVAYGEWLARRGATRSRLSGRAKVEVGAIKGEGDAKQAPDSGRDPPGWEVPEGDE